MQTRAGSSSPSCGSGRSRVYATRHHPQGRPGPARHPGAHQHHGHIRGGRLPGRCHAAAGSALFWSTSTTTSSTSMGTAARAVARARHRARLHRTTRCLPPTSTTLSPVARDVEDMQTPTRSAGGQPPFADGAGHRQATPKTGWSSIRRRRQQEEARTPRGCALPGPREAPPYRQHPRGAGVEAGDALAPKNQITRGENASIPRKKEATEGETSQQEIYLFLKREPGKKHVLSKKGAKGKKINPSNDKYQLVTRNKTNRKER